jgi:hypothetical protein
MYASASFLVSNVFRKTSRRGLGMCGIPYTLKYFFVLGIGKKVYLNATEELFFEDPVFLGNNQKTRNEYGGKMQIIKATNGL